MDISIITPTGDRPVAIDLCATWMARQTYDGTVQWIIVDDGVQPYAPQFRRPAWMLQRIRRNPAEGEDPVTSFAKNLLMALCQVVGGKVLIVEDDDWYASHHIEDMAQRLELADIAGHELQRYYHLPTRQWWTAVNHGSALCQTGLRREWLSKLEDACYTSLKDGSRGIDRKVWDAMRKPGSGAEVCLYKDGLSVVGMKGLPGRPGLGVGHRPRPAHGWIRDPDLSMLRSWIGSDVACYEVLHDGCSARR